MTWSLISNNAASSTDAMVVTIASTSTSGADIIFLGGNLLGTNDSGAVPTDSNGNTYVLVKAVPNVTAPICKLFYASAATGTFVTSGSSTFSWSSHTSTNPVYPSLFMLSFSGSAASPLDQTNTNAAAGGITSMQPGSVTPSLNGELLVTMAGFDGSDASMSITGGFLNPSFLATVASLAYGGSLGYLIQSPGTGAGIGVNPTWSWATAAEGSSVIGTFEAGPSFAPLMGQICM